MNRLRTAAAAMLLAGLLTGGVARAEPDPGTPLRIMLAGDSLTLGYGSSDGLGYRRRLSERLNAAGVSHIYTARAAHGGTLTSIPGKIGLAEALPPTALAEQPDLIVIAIGTNDAAGGAPLGGFEQTYRAMVQTLVNQDPDVRVVVVQVGYSNQSWARWQVDPVNSAIIRTWWWTVRSPTDRVIMADWTPVHPCRLYDGVHPHDDGYDDMADKLYTDIAPTMGWPALTYRWYRPPVRRPYYDRPAAVAC